MDPCKISYDICREYLLDHKSTMPVNLFQKLMGYTRSREIDKLASCTSELGEALFTPDLLSLCMQVEAFFKKNKSFSDEDRCRAEAISSFNRGEKLCRIANRRLDHYYIQRDRLDPDLNKWMNRMEKDIHRLLGDFSPFLEKIPSMVRVTAGATATRSRRASLPHLRISKRPYANPQAEKYLSTLSEYFGYGKIKVRSTLANRLEFVPKNWKTYRSIACEPEGNVFLQLAIDTYFKRKLKRWKINLRDQSRNQELARIGSIDGSLATIDLSMASDTLSYNTVAWLFPQPWFRYLCDTRSPESRGEASVRYAKFSSMGNGYTFVLETLVFAAACRAVGSKISCVYGDDIVIETELFEDLTKLLSFLGFKVNTEKSHTTGPFRESCGSNWYQGTDITPVYIRDIDRRKAMMCHLVNSLATICLPEGRLALYLAGIIREYSLPLVPFTESTISGVWVDKALARERKLIRTRNWIPKFKSYTPVAHEGGCTDSRALFLWYLDTLERGLAPSIPGLRPSVSWYRERYLKWLDDDRVVCRSRYTTSSHRFRRKWVHWNPPVVGAPDHLSWWSEYLSSLNSS